MSLGLMDMTISGAMSWSVGLVGLSTKASGFLLWGFGFLPSRVSEFNMPRGFVDMLRRHHAVLRAVVWSWIRKKHTQCFQISSLHLGVVKYLSKGIRVRSFEKVGFIGSR